MERQLLERMIGAAVLLVALVVIVPSVLDGRPDVDDPSLSSSSEPDSTAPEAPLRQHTIRLDRQPESPPVARNATEVPESKPEPKVVVAEAPKPKREPKVAVAEAPKSKPEPKVAVAEAPKPMKSTVAPPAQTQVIQPGWVVQLGSFSKRANAQGLADKTRARGFQSYLMPVERSGKTLFRVRVGPARKSRGEVAKLVDDLEKAGFKGQVVEQKAGG